MLQRSLLVHVGLLGVAGLFALRAWTADGSRELRGTEVDLWGGAASQVTQISYTDSKTKVRVTPEKDDVGSYFVGVVEKKEHLPKRRAEPENEADEGVGGASPAEDEPALAALDEWVTEEFLSVKEGQKLFDAVAPLRAKRRLGKLDAARLADFGLGEDQGTLEVTIGGEARILHFGGTTPGGVDHYARTDDGEAYVVSGDVAELVRNAGSRLMAREFHTFVGSDVHHVTVSAGGKTRELLRQPGEHATWANLTTPDAKDETASNWMTKVEQLRVLKYVRNPAPAVTPADLVVHVDYFDAKNKPLGSFELSRQLLEAGKKDFLGRSEQSRWYGSVIRSTAEQIEQDLASILNP